MIYCSSGYRKNNYMNVLFLTATIYSYFVDYTFQIITYLIVYIRVYI